VSRGATSTFLVEFRDGHLEVITEGWAGTVMGGAIGGGMGAGFAGTPGAIAGATGGSKLASWWQDRQEAKNAKELADTKRRAKDAENGYYFKP
jgi:outer membrane lipoprotein SlyB